MLRIAIKYLCHKNLKLSSPSYLVTFQKHTEIQKSNSLITKKSSVILIQKYAISSYIDFMEKKCPKIINLYRTFQVGTKGFYEDLKQYLRLRWKIRKYGLDTLTREELQLIIIMTKDLKKIIPILLMSIIPLTNYIIVPLAFYFPHKFLTSHFWTIQDKQNFMLKDHEKRLKHSEPLLRCMESTVNMINDPKLLATINSVITQLNNGTHPIIDDIINCKRLFSGPPYSLDCIRRKHVKELLKVHGISPFSLRNKNKLFQRGIIIKQWDIAIEREGGVTKLPDDAIQWALSFRGLNPINMSTDCMQIWLNQWLLMSSKVNIANISLLLHCPIFLAYNHKNNFTILYNDKKKSK